MVDELQDTNPVQLELIELIARGNLFTVGDAQQSIYGFRHADVELFERRGERARERGGEGDAADQLPLAPRDPRRAQRRVRSRCSATQFMPLRAGARRYGAGGTTRASSCSSPTRAPTGTLEGLGVAVADRRGAARWPHASRELLADGAARARGRRC